MVEDEVIDELTVLFEKAGRAHHDAFIDAMLDHWRARTTEAVIETVEATAAQNERGAALEQIVARLDHRLEAALRRAGSDSPSVAKALRSVDNRRVGYLAELWGRHEKAQDLARVEYALFVGWQMLWPDDTPPDMQDIALTLGAAK